MRTPAKIGLNQASSYVAFLPAIYRDGETSTQGNLVGRFLKISEKLLTGIVDGVQLPVRLPDGSLTLQSPAGIEEILDRIHEYFDPLFTPPFPDGDSADFVGFLSSWIALIQNQTWSLPAQRRLLDEIVPLYRQRGTQGGLTRYLSIYLGDFPGAQVSIQEFLEGIQVGVSGTVGTDSIVGGSPPYFFFVRIALNHLNGATAFRNLVLNTRAIVDLEKPAHTYYSLLYQVPGMVVGQSSTVGQDSLIGTPFGVFA